MGTVDANQYLAILCANQSKKKGLNNSFEHKVYTIFVGK
jgi:hypothetical protein